MRFIKVTEHRTKKDFARVVKELTDTEYAEATRLYLVADNLNTHFSNAFYETFEPDEAKRILEKIEFHYIHRLHCAPQSSTHFSSFSASFSILVLKQRKR